MHAHSRLNSRSGTGPFLAGSLMAAAALLLWSCGRQPPHGNQPARLIADFSGGHVTLRGSLPDAGAHDRVLERAHQLYGPGNVQDRIEVSAQVAEAPWVSGDALLLPLVESGISDGQVVFDGQRLQLMGQVPTQAIRDQIATRATRAAGNGITVSDELQASR